MSEQPSVTVQQQSLVVQVLDKTSPTIEINPDATYVTVDASEKPVITVNMSGGRGPIWLPGSYWDGTGLAALLSGAITRQQLSNDLSTEIDVLGTDLTTAQINLNQFISDTGEITDGVLTRMTQTENAVGLQVERIDALQADVIANNVQVDVDGVRLTAAEGSLVDHDNYIITQQAILKNEWTVKIQENTDGSAYCAGVGLLVYPIWEVNKVYDQDYYVWFDDHAYKCKTTHTSLVTNVPPDFTYWQLIPYATKSQFGVLADSFFVQTSVNGNKIIPFIVQDDQVLIDGDLIVNGLISAGALSAGRVFTWSIESPNYVPSVSGYKIDATTGHAEFNNIDLTINYSDISDAPTSLSEIDSAAATKLSGIAAGADVTSSNTSNNTSNVGGVSAVHVAGWAAANSTYINGGYIYTGSIVANSIASLTITADKIAANTITASEIAAGTITADKIATGTITAASGVIADLAVSTVKIQGNAVTLPVSAYTSGYQTATTTLASVQTISMTTQGNSVYLHYGCTIFCSVTNGFYEFQLLRDSTELLRFTANVNYASINGSPLSVMFVDAPSVNTHGYTVKMRLVSGTGSFGQRSLFGLECRR